MAHLCPPQKKNDDVVFASPLYQLEAKHDFVFHFKLIKILIIITQTVLKTLVLKMAANINTTQNEAINKNNHDTDTQQLVSPALLGPLRLTDPNDNLPDIKIDKKCNPDHIPLPLIGSDFYQNAPLPFAS